MLRTETIQGCPIGPVEIAEIQGLIGANPGWSRRRLSQVLAQRWQWYAASGQLKDMAARTLLLKLQERGLIDDDKVGKTPIHDGRLVSLGFHTVRISVGGDYRDWEAIRSWAVGLHPKLLGT